MRHKDVLVLQGQGGPIVGTNKLVATRLGRAARESSFQLWTSREGDCRPCLLVTWYPELNRAAANLSLPTAGVPVCVSVFCILAQRQ